MTWIPDRAPGQRVGDAGGKANLTLVNRSRSRSPPQSFVRRVARALRGGCSRLHGAKGGASERTDTLCRVEHAAAGYLCCAHGKTERSPPRADRPRSGIPEHWSGSILESTHCSRTAPFGMRPAPGPRAKAGADQLLALNNAFPCDRLTHRRGASALAAARSRRRCCMRAPSTVLTNC